MKNKLLSTMLVLTAGVHCAHAGNMGVAPTYYSFKAGPYLGASIGGITNVAGLPPSAYKGFSGIISGGLAHIDYQNVYFAGEFWGDTSTTSKNFPRGTIRTTSIRSSWAWGFDILPGVAFNDQHVLAYVRLGVLTRRFSDINQQKAGVRIGLGGQTNLYKNLDIRAEYIYAQFKHTSVGIPISDQYNLGLVLKFV